MMPDRPSGTGPTVWRGLVILNLIVTGAMVVLLANAISDNRDALDRGKELGCRIGGFLVDAPIIQTPGTTDQQFAHSLERAGDFLTSLRDLDCAGLGGVTSVKITRQLHALHRAQSKGGGASGNPGNGPPSPPGGAPTPAPAPPPVTPPPTTTTPPSTVHQVCHLTPLGTRVCHIVGL